ncbi:hypothetical protein TRFO_30894 [Tritrichomonas foetus]|uniref:KATNIP domain-containing protein n=1 Tax=Tritrichomonas foetus TaxID=1144522 RepID=A0A1J4JX73_9EUKA|nr:hypothetical protein TRFO_30894 [Tritrichomonas foetus]|eukprot:OHT02132.1 hypothetical protein TRFO_30894 [Tritrichomonas foetus]
MYINSIEQKLFIEILYNQMSFITELIYSIDDRQDSRAAPIPIPRKPILPRLDVRQIPTTALMRPRRNSQRNPNPSSRSSITRFNDAIQQIKSGRSLTRFSSTGDTPFLKTYIIQLKIISNYGEPNKLSISELDILDEHSRQIEILKVKFDPPDNLSNTAPTELLVNSDIIKTENKPEWSTNFAKLGFSILLYVQCVNSPCYLRIWNGRDKNDSNVKDVMVTVGDVIVSRTTISKDFGQVIRLSKKELPTAQLSEIDNMYDKRIVNPALIDKFGELSYEMVKEISFTLLENFDNSSYYCLNGIDLFDFNGEVVSTEEFIKTATVKNVELVSTVHRLFRPNKNTKDISEMFICKNTSGNKPEIVIEFYKPCTISMIRIWNGNSDEYDNGVSRIQITVNQNNSIWRRKIKKSKGKVPGMKEFVTKIWLTDVPSLRKKIQTQARKYW